MQIALPRLPDDVRRTGATLVPPYDDLRTMAGQGTIAAEILASAYASLPDPSLREVLELWLEEGYTQPEIARTLRCSVTTVGRRMAEIRARLGALSDGPD